MARNWTVPELKLAINLYHKIPFGKMHRQNPEVIHLSTIIDRTPSAVAFKLVNFASLDNTLNQKGMGNVSKLDREVWADFYENMEEAVFESEMKLESDAFLPQLNWDYIKETERQRIIKARVGQSFFRKSVMSAYKNRCCITGISNPSLLIASHIIPWNIDQANRLNPTNGLALNALHDKAFDQGLITVTPDYTMRISTQLKATLTTETRHLFVEYEKKQINLPERFLPNPEYLAYHQSHIFKQ